jgi:hypothetical protein
MESVNVGSVNVSKVNYQELRQKIFRKLNIQPIVDPNVETYKCDCGVTVKTRNIEQHEKSDRHQKNIDRLCKQVYDYTKVNN